MHFRLTENTVADVDSLGNELTNEQASYFRNSKVRDYEGNLLVCHHGTDARFNTFEKGDIGFHFGTEKVALNRREFKKDASDWYVDKYYLNITNPFVEEFDYGAWDGVTIAVVWMFGTSYDGLAKYIVNGTLEGDMYIPHDFSDENSVSIIKDVVKRFADVDDWSTTYDYNSEPNRIMRKLFESKGYDGIQYVNTFEDDDGMDYSYIAFHPNQIKAVYGKTPTSSGNFNEKIEHMMIDEESSCYDELFVVDTVRELKELMRYLDWDEYRVVDDSKVSGKYYVGYSYNHIHAGILEVAAENYWLTRADLTRFTDNGFVLICQGQDNDHGMFGEDLYYIKYVFEDYTILARDQIEDTDLIKQFGNLLSKEIHEDGKEWFEENLTEDLTTEIDSAGNELTPEQSAFFKDSKIRSYSNGKLLVCYHASTSSFDSFDKAKIGSGNGGANFGRGFYFTPLKSIADEYGEAKEYYLNIVNPYPYYQNDKNTILSILAKSGYEYKKEYIDSLEDEFLLWDADLIDDVLYFALVDASPWDALSDMLIKSGYDGIIADNEIIAFEPNQIKRISNKMPTSSNNLNESMNNCIAIDVSEAEEIATQFVSSTPTYQTWIDTQGRFLDASNLGSHYNMVDEVFWQLTDKGELNGVSPVDLDPTDYNEMTDVIFDSFSKAGWIQIGLDCKFASIFVKPTREQYDAIEQYLDYAFDKGAYTMEVCIENNGFHSASYNLKEVTPEYVVGRIKRCFSSGNLFESTDNFPAFEKRCFDIASTIIGQIESKLDKYGFEIDLITDYEDYDDFVGMFLASEQTDVKVFPIVVNPKVIYDYAEKNGHKNNSDFLVWSIESTLWHEVGHGIVSYLSDMYDFDWDEEDVVEEFATIMCDSGTLGGELYDALTEFEDEYLYEAVDSTGKELTSEQETFFANSKVRDDKGNLMVCYHGTENPGFTEFNPQQGKSQFGKYKFNTHNVNYFTSDFETAKSYTLIGVGDTDGEHKNIYACYVNITNPYVVDNQTDVDIKSFQNIKDKKIRDVQVRTFDRIFRKWSRWYPDASDLDDINRDMHTLNFEFRPTDDSEEYFDLYTLGKNTAFGSEHQEMFDYTLEEYFSDNCYEEFRDAVVGNYEEEYDDYYLTIDDIIKFVLLMNEEEGTGYDGIIVSDIYDVGPRGSIWSALPATDIITLKSSNQIKRINNTAPTGKGNIDEDLGDSMNFSSALEADIKRSLNAVYKDRDKYKTQEDLEDAMYWAINDCLDGLQFISKSKSEVIEDIIAIELEKSGVPINESVSNTFKFRLV